LVPKALGHLGCKVELPSGTIWRAEKLVNDLTTLNGIRKIPALRGWVCKEAEDESALVGDQVVRMSIGGGVVRDAVGRGIAPRHADGRERLERSILGYQDGIAACTLHEVEDLACRFPEAHRVCRSRFSGPSLNGLRSRENANVRA